MHPVSSPLIYLGVHRDAGQLSTGRCSVLPSDPETLGLEMSRYLPYLIPPALTWMPAWSWPFPLDLVASFGSHPKEMASHPKERSPSLLCHPNCPFTVTSCLIFSGPSAFPTLFPGPPGSSFPTKWVVEGCSSCAGASLLTTVLSLLCCFLSGLWASWGIGCLIPMFISQNHRIS